MQMYVKYDNFLTASTDVILLLYLKDIPNVD